MKMVPTKFDIMGVHFIGIWCSYNTTWYFQSTIFVLNMSWKHNDGIEQPGVFILGSCVEHISVLNTYQC